MHHKRREILNRAYAGRTTNTIIDILRNHWLRKNNDLIDIKRDQLPTLYALNDMSSEELLVWLMNQDEHIRTTALRLILDDSPIDWLDGLGACRAKPVSDKVVDQLRGLAATD